MENFRPDRAQYVVARQADAIQYGLIFASLFTRFDAMKSPDDIPEDATHCAVDDLIGEIPEYSREVVFSALDAWGNAGRGIVEVEQGETVIRIVRRPQQLRASKPARQKPESGVLYVMTNPSMPGMVKIGISSLSARERAKQLSAQTASPSPSVVEKEWPCVDPEQVESEVHGRLASAKMPRREFFRMSPSDAIAWIDAFFQAGEVDHE